MRRSASETLRSVLRGPHLKRALWTSIVVGSILNAINQPAALSGRASIDWPKLLLTFCVPFLVATYGAYSALRELPDVPEARRE